MNLRRLTPNRLWIGLFLVWAFLLTGVLGSFLGGPGLLQAWRLQRLLNSKQANFNQIQDDLLKLQTEAEALEKSRVTQLREIRRVLGFAAKDEIIFDFSR